MVNVMRAIAYTLLPPRVQVYGRHRVRRWWWLLWQVERNDWTGGRDVPPHRRVNRWRRVAWHRRRLDAVMNAQALDKQLPERRAAAFRRAMAAPGSGRWQWCGCGRPGCATCTRTRSLTRPVDVPHQHAH